MQHAILGLLRPSNVVTAIFPFPPEYIVLIPNLKLARAWMFVCRKKCHQVLNG